MSEMRWLDAEQQTDWMRFAAVLELLPAALDAQLNRDENLTHFDYFTLAMLSEAPERTLRMSDLASRTNATLPRLSRVVSRLESLGYIERRPCPGDRRATNAVLTDDGFVKLETAAPGHVSAVRRLVVDALGEENFRRLGALSARLLEQLDPEGRTFARTED